MKKPISSVKIWNKKRTDRRFHLTKRRFFNEKENIKPDVIVVDPPRKGLDQISIEYILKFNPKKIGYISCNPATLVRDLKILEKKYEITTIIPVDMFPQTRTC